MLNNFHKFGKPEKNKNYSINSQKSNLLYLRTKNSAFKQLKQGF